VHEVKLETTSAASSRGLPQGSLPLVIAAVAIVNLYADGDEGEERAVGESQHTRVRQRPRVHNNTTQTRHDNTYN